MKKECLFCKIVQKQLKSWILFEDKNIIVFLDAFPVEKGHCLIVTKRCISNIMKLKEEEILSLHEMIKKTCNKLKLNLKSEGFNLINNFNKIAGQIINHFHLHVIPKYKIGYGFSWKKEKAFSNSGLENVWKEIKGD